MNVGIVGLGLIGGSLAKAYKDFGHQVYGDDNNLTNLEYVQLTGTIDGILSPDVCSTCELILLAINPLDTIEWLEHHAEDISKESIVIDCAGVKRMICERCFPIAEKHGFTFIGGHPMAGSHKNGFKNSRKTLFHGAPMVIVPPKFDDITLFAKIKELLQPAGFRSITVSDAKEHDEMIAFTSQLAHVVSNAFIKSPTARQHKGFSAGSYKDLTRVAWLDADMWTQLFFFNKDFLIKEIECLQDELKAYQDALLSGNQEEMKRLLQEGKERKAEIDGR